MTQGLSLKNRIEFLVISEVVLDAFDIYKNTKGAFRFEAKKNTYSVHTQTLLKKIWHDLNQLNLIKFIEDESIKKSELGIQIIDLEILNPNECCTAEQMSVAMDVTRNFTKFRFNHIDTVDRVGGKTILEVYDLIGNQYIVLDGLKEATIKLEKQGKDSTEAGQDFVKKNFPNGLEGRTKDYAYGVCESQIEKFLQLDAKEPNSRNADEKTEYEELKYLKGLTKKKKGDRRKPYKRNGIIGVLRKLLKK